MIFHIYSDIENRTYLLEHNKGYNNKDFNQLVQTVNFELSHHANTSSIVKILCSDYAFSLIVTKQL